MSAKHFTCFHRCIGAFNTVLVIISICGALFLASRCFLQDTSAQGSFVRPFQNDRLTTRLRSPPAQGSLRRRLGSGDSARKKDCFALSGGNRFVRPLLTASSVIAVMPACMLTVPNPGSRSEWPAHCDRGIHYVWPCKFGAELALVVVSTIAAHIPRKQNEAAKQHH